MMLTFIGLGLGGVKDISVKGLEAVKRCDAVYLENYTSKLTNASVSELEKFYGKKVILADRIMVENDVQKILDEAKRKDVSLLIIGDVFGATTHAMILLEAKKQGIKVEIIHNASILNVVGEVGLELYKFGHITSIPFENKNIQTPVEIFKKNYENNLHTLFLLDLDPKNGKFMTVNEAADYLIRNGVGNIRAVACGALGSKNSEIRAGNLKDLDIKGFPQCLIIPAKKLHFVEEEALDALAH